MSEPLLLPIKPGTLSQKDRRALSAAGVIVIEHENPGELRLIRPWSEIDGSDMLLAAMRALKVANNYNGSHIAFTNAMLSMIEARAQKGPKT